MILYHLKCECGHHFDAWFRDSATYDRQEKRGQVSCSSCSSSRVTKAIMAPRLSGDHRKKGERDNLPVPVASGGGDIAVPDEIRARAVARQIIRSMRKMRKHAEENFENVGENFAEEARAIHYGEAEERAIYGEATLAEAKELMEEDIPVGFLGPKKRNRRKLT
jgi:hypothetical protein